MNTQLENLLSELTCATSVDAPELLQSLWSGYGSISRYNLIGAESSGLPLESVVVKEVRLPDTAHHPRGWNTDRSHQRKIRSYQVESTWYRDFSQACDEHCRVPRCYGLEANGEEFLMILEDLDASCFNERRSDATLDEMKACLSWLAHFHARFMGHHSAGLWDEGCYWHLSTRPDELEALEDAALKRAAPLIEAKLIECPYQTLVHGDAKLANFCFASDGRVAAVDFQYVGRGCGMKDVAYFIGSCFDEEECTQHEQALLNYYFEAFSQAISRYQPSLDAKTIEHCWRPLFKFAWADFHRFLKGWSPGHWKLHGYSERVTREVLAELELGKQK